MKLWDSKTTYKHNYKVIIMSMQWKKFRSPNSSVRRVALLSGHVFEIGLEYVNLPEFAWSEAYRAGCMSEDMAVNNSVPSELLKALSDEATEMDKIKEIILDAIEVSERSAFKKDGNPNLVYLTHKLGYRPEPGLVGKVWFRIQNGE